MDSEKILQNIEKEQVKSHTDMMNAIQQFRAALKQSDEKIVQLEQKYNALKAEQISLQRESLLHKKSLNNREQYARLLSVRIDNMIVNSDLVSQAGVDYACMSTAYEKIILPVLSKAVQPHSGGQEWKKGRPKLKKVPEMLELLSNGHFLRSRTPVPTVIIRFHSRFLRNLFLRLRREFQPKPLNSETTASGKGFYGVRPDLTQANFRFLQQLRSDDRVHSAWAFDCKLRFKLQSDVQNNKTIIHETDEVFSTVSKVLIDTQNMRSSQTETSPCNTTTSPSSRNTTTSSSSRNTTTSSSTTTTKASLTASPPARSNSKGKLTSEWKTPRLQRSTRSKARKEDATTRSLSAQSRSTPQPTGSRSDESRLPNSSDESKTLFRPEFLNSTSDS